MRQISRLTSRLLLLVTLLCSSFIYSCGENPLANLGGGTPALFRADFMMVQDIDDPMLFEFYGSYGPEKAPVASYAWDFGDSSPIDDAQNTSHKYMSDGTYSVTLSVTFTTGRTVKSKPQTIKVSSSAVKDEVIVDFAQEQTSPKEYKFTNHTVINGSETGVSYVWSFGDGTVETKNSRTSFYHEFPEYDRTYRVTLTVMKGGEVLGAPKTYAITTGATPSWTGKVDFTYSPLAITAGNVVTFTNATSPHTSAISYKWDFGDGDIQNSVSNTNVTHTFTTSGSYKVLLTAYIEGKSVGNSVKDLWISPAGSTIKVTTDFIPTKVTPKTFSFVNTTTVTGISEAELTYLWSFGHGTPTSIPEKTFTHEFPEYSKSYTVTLTVQKGTEQLGSPKTISIITGDDPAWKGVAGFTYSPTNVIVGKAVTFTNTTTNHAAGLNYEWNFGDGIIIPKNDTAPFSHTFTAVKNYTVTLTVLDGRSPVATAEEKISVNAAANVTANFTATQGASPLKFNFTNTTSFTGISEAELTYLWSFGHGTPTTMADKAFSHDFPAYSTSYTVTLTVKKGETILSSKSYSITTGANPAWSGTASFTYSPTTVTATEEVTFTNTTSPKKVGLSYVWDFGGNIQPETTSTTPVKYTFPAPGTPRVTLTVIEAGASVGTYNKTITVNPKGEFNANFTATKVSPKVFTFTNTTSATGMTLTGLTYEWDFGDGKPMLPKTDKTAFNYEFPDYSTSYTVTLRVKSDKILSTRTNSVVTGADPTWRGVVDFSYPTLPVALGTVITFNNLTTNHVAGMTYSWNFGDGSPALPATSNTPVVKTLTKAGTFNITLTAFLDGTKVGDKIHTITVNSAIEPEPSEGVLKVFATYQASFLISETGDLYSWGFNTYGQLGLGNTTDKKLPTKLETVDSGLPAPKWTAVSGNTFHTVAISTSGDLYTWGRNNMGQLGTGIAEEKNTTSPIKLTSPSGVKWKKIAAGSDNGFGITETGDLYSWGKNSFYQLGFADATNKSTPTKIATIETGAAAPKWKEVCAGTLYAMAISEAGDLYIWGDGRSGQLGLSTTSQQRPKKVTVAGVSQWQQVACADSTAFALSANNDIYATGANTHGQTGTGSTSNVNVFTKITSTNIGVAPKWTLLSANYNGGHAISESGDLYSWGWNSNGQLGVGENGDFSSTRNKPTKIVTVNGITGAFTWKSVSVGNTHVLGILNKGSGEVYAWGRNLSSELGVGETVKEKTIPTKVQIDGSGGDTGGGTDLSKWVTLTEGLNNINVTNSKTDVLLVNVATDKENARVRDAKNYSLSSVRKTSSYLDSGYYDSLAIDEPITGESEEDIFFAKLRQREHALFLSGAEPMGAKDVHRLTVPTTIGSTHEFKYNKDFVMAECVKISEKAIIYVEDGYTVSDANLTEIATKFDNIYNVVTNNFGIDTDTDGNGKIIILLYYLGDALNGFFTSEDKHPVSYAPTSNEADMLHINVNLILRNDMPQVLDTIAHEFQHLTYFDNRKRSSLGIYDDWLNEGISMVAPYYISNSLHSLTRTRIDSFLKSSHQNQSLLKWTSSNYGYSALFAHYLMDRFGGDIFKKIYNTPKMGIYAVETATGMDFNDLFKDFAQAVYLSGTGISSDAKYTFKSLNLLEFGDGAKKGLNYSQTKNSGEGVAVAIYPYSFSLIRFNGATQSVTLPATTSEGTAAPRPLTEVFADTGTGTGTGTGGTGTEFQLKLYGFAAPQ